MTSTEQAKAILESLKVLTSIENGEDFTNEDVTEIVELVEHLVEIISFQEEELKELSDLMAEGNSHGEMIRIESGTPEFEELMTLLNQNKSK